MRYLVLILALLCAPAYAQIKVDPTYPAYTTFKIDVTVPEGHDFRSVHWTFSPPKISAQEGPDGALYATGVPGLTYKIVCDVVSGKSQQDGTALIEKTAHKHYEATFKIEAEGGNGGGGGDIDNDSDVNPPVPAVKNPRVLIVEETARRSVENAKILNDSSFWSDVVLRGFTWRLYDLDSPDLKPDYKTAAAKVGFPALVIHDDNRVLSVMKLPKTTAEISAEMKRVTNK
jgi:hypothetical protein